MVEKLLRWYYINIIEDKRITTRDFKKKAIEFSKDSTFRASKGWLQKFRKRYIINLNQIIGFKIHQKIKQIILKEKGNLFYYEDLLDLLD